METPDNTPEAELIKTGTAVAFKVIDTTLQVSTDGEQAHVEVKLAILDDDDKTAELHLRHVDAGERLHEFLDEYL